MSHLSVYLVVESKRTYFKGVDNNHVKYGDEVAGKEYPNNPKVNTGSWGIMLKQNVD